MDGRRALLLQVRPGVCNSMLPTLVRTCCVDVDALMHCSLFMVRSRVCIPVLPTRVLKFHRELTMIFN